jgi:very-short-patch-repair endonuclease
MYGTQRARRLRLNQTEVERRLWSKLRNRRLIGCKFRRQVPLGAFIVDFICIERGLVIELDGGQHNENRDDEARTEALEKAGWRVLRFWNNEVSENFEGVLERIIEALGEDVVSPHPDPLPQAGEGGLRERP